MYTDNCAGQYKCRQNIFQLASFPERHPGSRAVHKFAQKFKFKGPWDATVKIVKEGIRNCELKFKRCANATDCYETITKRLAHNGNGKTQNQWKKWELEKNKRIVTKIFFRTNCIFIGLAVDKRQKYDELVESGEKHIIFADRENIPNMRAISRTQQYF